MPPGKEKDQVEACFVVAGRDFVSLPGMRLRGVNSLRVDLFKGLDV